MEIAVDLDGTLAEYRGNRDLEVIGKIVPAMKIRVLDWIRNGHKVAIFTSRVSGEGAVGAREAIKGWLFRNELPDLEITCIKKRSFAQIWDDNAVGVNRNEGSVKDNKPSAMSGQVGGAHYKDMKIQPVEFCRANNMLGMESSVVKYVSRHKQKNGAIDIRKAIHCLELILELDYDR